MNDKFLNIAIVTNVIPSYREGFYDRLFNRKDLKVKVYCQDRIPGMNLKTIHNKYPNNVQLLKFISAKREKLSWQFIPWKKVLSDYDVVFIEGNPRNISHALFATYLRIIHKNVVLWSMAHSFRSIALTEYMRLLWLRIFNYLFLYTDAEVEYLCRKGFKTNYMVGMNNGLDQNNIDAAILMWQETQLKQWRIESGLVNRTLLLSCARLEPKNKYNQIVQSLPAIIDRIPDILWCVIGTGPEKEKLEGIVNKAGLSQHVRFVGELYNERELAPWFLSSEIYVHPASIGLGLMHAFGYGLPVVTHGNPEKHGPEYAAFEPELTGRNYHEGDIQHLSDTVIKLLLDNEVRARMKNYVQQVARERFNVDIMVERFVQVANKASNA